MSVEEMKRELIEKIAQIEDEVFIRKIAAVVNNPKPRPTKEQIYEEIKAQYGNTLKKLAE